MKFTLGTGLDDDFNEVPAYGFDFCGTFVTDPFISECGRFLVSPAYYDLTSIEAQELVTLNEKLMLQRRRS